jgi:hypothetical protein
MNTETKVEKEVRVKKLQRYISRKHTSTSLHFAEAPLAHCQNFSAAGLSRPFSAAIPIDIGFGSGVRCKTFTRFPKL